MKSWAWAFGGAARAAAGLLSLSAVPVHAQSLEELREMSISSLSKLDVTSVTRSSASLADAPASIYVITHDDIVRSGTLTLPGILRLAPNLHVMRGGPNDTVVAARGLSGNDQAQNFSNKLLVLIDGRSVYSPLYSGVYWDMPDILPEDVDRIEVISGPGATLWGSNAVNGVINIITRDAGASQGLYGTGVVGNRTYDLGLRHGGHAGGNASYRLFVKRHENFESASGLDDGNRRTQGGFRFDWNSTPADALMVQGDAYYGSRSQGAAADENFHGYDLLARWRRSAPSGTTLQLQAYYDHTARRVEDGGGHFALDTFDMEGQHGFTLGQAHSIVWGGGARISRYRIGDIPGLDFVPGRRSLFVGNLFAQDSIAIAPTLTGTIGAKLEQRSYAGLTFLPSVRLSWKPAPATLIWGAVSRAVRSPTPFDEDAVESIGQTVILTALSSFRSEKLTAYELGTRLTLSPRASLSVSTFYNVYDDLRSVDPAPGGFLPLRWGNGIKGDSYGLDAWADIRAADWWRLKPGYSLLIHKFRFKPDAVPLLGISQVGNDPKHRATLRSSMDIGPQVNVDFDLRYVSALPDPHVAAYVELGARLGWQFDERAELSVSGFNLLHRRHRELPAAQATPLGRSLFVALKCTI
ncbi:TonB-dependent receptor [Sphingobium sp. JS3065]|uniref:TonB-dependent receptor plug domain-containing protein n=1 Tax=Sphingobium sp. JS3065 TaxID=2970925 RepID=UPI002265679F|nr:TonB-dependent receptor [Sphingobium sp. JS3065]UZW57139.1 TonB-dependent receptor [Sphingobium sp. JS3065]